MTDYEQNRVVKGEVGWRYEGKETSNSEIYTPQLEEHKAHYCNAFSWKTEEAWIWDKRFWQVVKVRESEQAVRVTNLRRRNMKPYIREVLQTQCQGSRNLIKQTAWGICKKMMSLSENRDALGSLSNVSMKLIVENVKESHLLDTYFFKMKGYFSFTSVYLCIFPA